MPLVPRMATKRNAVQASLPCEIMKKYPGQEQVELSVVIRIPSHWFNGMDAAEKAKLFEATAVEYSKCRTFGQGRGVQLLTLARKVSYLRI